ncbi:MAG: UDP-N-acetylmuramoyl-L-alanine--D-glutamate ligase [Desulfonatronovibrionaceae bacterium]
MRELIHRDQLKGHKVAVVGAGRSGLAAASLALALGARVRILEKNPDDSIKKAVSRQVPGVEYISGEHSSGQFAGMNMVILSPGIPMGRIKPLLYPDTALYSELELASWFVHEPVAAVTGTNGKTTTVLLVAHVLEKCGKKVFAGGNLGTPLSSYVLGESRADILVLEVSSFQLQACSGFRPQVGVLLNFSANHLDHHESSEEYFQAKTRLFASQRGNDLAILPLELKEKMEGSGLLQGRRAYFTAAGGFACPALTGRHNQANLEAAWLVCRYFGIDNEQFARAITDFEPPAHRQEVFLKTRGVTFVNDSKATTPAAMGAALEAFPHPVRLLAGGLNKGARYKHLAPLVREKVSKVYLFGQSRDVFEQDWAKITDMDYSSTLEEAVAKALSDSGSGDTVLLSPGTSSFDQFKNYEHRGNRFKELVRETLKQGS